MTTVVNMGANIENTGANIDTAKQPPNCCEKTYIVGNSLFGLGALIAIIYLILKVTKIWDSQKLLKSGGTIAG